MRSVSWRFRLVPVSDSSIRDRFPIRDRFLILLPPDANCHLIRAATPSHNGAWGFLRPHRSHYITHDEGGDQAAMISVSGPLRCETVGVDLDVGDAEAGGVDVGDGALDGFVE